MVGQEAEEVLVVVRAAKLQVGEGLVQGGHVHRGQSGQLRVQGVGAREGEEELVVLAGDGEQTLDPVGEAVAPAQQAEDHHLGSGRHRVQVALDIRLGLQEGGVGGAHRREVGRQTRDDLAQRQQVGVGVGEEEEAAAAGGKGWRGAGRLVPAKAGEDVVGQRGWRRQVAAGRQHLLDVVVDGEDEARIVHRMEADGAAVEHEHGHVRQRAGTEAAALGEMHAVAQLPPLPLRVVEVGGDGRMAALGVAAAAAGGADEEHPALAGNVDHLAVGAGDQVAGAGRALGAGARSWTGGQLAVWAAGLIAHGASRQHRMVERRSRPGGPGPAARRGRRRW